MSLSPPRASPTHSIAPYRSRTLDDHVYAKQALPLGAASEMPLNLGPRLDLMTTEDDLERHQRAVMFPPVRPKNYAPPKHENHQLPNEDLKQDLGELIYPFVQQIYPSLARKLTGMLMELPNNELIKCANSSSVLFDHLNNAKRTLFDYAYESNDEQLKSLIEGKHQNENIDHSEKYAAAFQEDSAKLTKNRFNAEGHCSGTQNSFYASQTFNTRQNFNNESIPRSTSCLLNQSHERAGLIPKDYSKHHGPRTAENFYSLGPRSCSTPNSSRHDPLLKPRATRHLGENEHSKYLQTCHHDFQDLLFKNKFDSNQKIFNETEQYRSYRPKINYHQNSYPILQNNQSIKGFSPF